MARVRANGVDLNVRRLPPRAGAGGPGPAPVVVFLHGAFIDSLASFYFTLAPAFAKAGYDVVLYDQRGHGRSERPPTGYRVGDFTADLDALLDALDIDRPVHLVGNSFGGTVALDFAVRHPERAASALVIESGPPTRAWAEIMRAALAQATSSELSPDRALVWFVEQYRTMSSTREIDRYDAHLARLGASAGRLMGETTIVRDIPDSEVLSDERIRSLRCPVFLVNGGDGLVAEQAAHARALLPDVRVAEVPGQKHSVLVEAPDEVGRLALAWVDAQVSRVSGAPLEPEQRVGVAP
ncbi:alpha/beta fold hydrolase [Streptomyces radicis]|uniref:Alpha/beta hydrolase n=1 Tax=Streptomyces radicis TaxID=1750517 RepID=A0A3A9W5D2_9ACTN|nr:alpha/beta hydrolase [Streptomyces radicis]RKN08358.1 alpha/beta hydrolase [Streptomyces radicis]RKN21606.1 alpha/beta hydrolase [Streptomyces radicis]